MERELRALYLRWVSGLTVDSKDLDGKIALFQRQSEALIAKLGGRTAALGALADFPVPKLLELSPYAGKVYVGMQQAAVQAGIMTGLSSKEAARVMFRAGMDKSYRRLERLARTETVSAYWKNQWDSTADLPLLVMLWGSEESKRTCDYCLSRDGYVVADSNIRDHPNGRCTLIPTLRSHVAYKGTLQPDGSVTMDPEWAPQRTKGVKAKASTVPVTQAQLSPLSGKQNPAALSKAQPAQTSHPMNVQEVKSALTDPVVPALQPLPRSMSAYKKSIKGATADDKEFYLDGRTSLLDRNQFEIEQLAIKNKMTEKAVRQQISHNLQTFVNESTPSIMIDSKNISSILQDGFKSAHDTGTGIGAGDSRYIEMRNTVEGKFWGKDTHPIYGFLDNPALSTKELESYGNVKVVLKDAVKDRSTVSFGDSLNSGRVLAPGKATAVDEYSVSYNSAASAFKGDVAGATQDYAEIQMPSLGIEDIAEMVFKRKPTQSVVDLLASKNISWRMA